MHSQDIYKRAVKAKDYIEERPYSSLEIALKHLYSENELTSDEADILAVLTECNIILGMTSYEATLQVGLPATVDAMDAIEAGASDVVVWDNVNNKDCPLTDEAIQENKTVLKWLCAIYIPF